MILNILSQPAPRPTGAILLCLCACLFIAPAGRAATARVNVTIAFDDAAQQGPVTGIKVEPISPPWSESPGVVIGDPITRASKTSPVIITNLFGSDDTNTAIYKVTITSKVPTVWYFKAWLTNGNANDLSIAAPGQSASWAAGFFAPRSILSNAIQRISTGGVAMASSGITNVNWTTGVTGYVSGATAHLGVSASGSGSGIGSIGLLTNQTPTSIAGTTNITLTNSGNVVFGAVSNASGVVVSANVSQVVTSGLHSAVSSLQSTTATHTAILANVITQNYSGVITTEGIGVNGLSGLHAVTFYDFTSAIIGTDSDGVAGETALSTGLTYDGTSRTLSLSDTLQNLHSTGSNNVDYVNSIATKQTASAVLDNLVNTASNNVLKVDVADSIFRGPFKRTPQKIGNGTISVTGTNFLTFATNASFDLVFSGTATNGQSLITSISNYSTATIYATNADGIRNRAVGTNQNIIALWPLSVTQLEFNYVTNHVGGGQWEWDGKGGVELGLTIPTGFSITNTVERTLALTSYGWVTNGDFVTATNTSSFTDVLNITIPANVIPSNGAVEVILRGRYHNASSGFSPTNWLFFGGSNVLAWTNSILALNNANQWRKWETTIWLFNCDSTGLQTVDVDQKIGGAQQTFPGVGNQGATTVSSWVPMQSQFAFDTTTNNALRFQVALTNGTASLVVYPALVRVHKSL